MPKNGARATDKGRETIRAIRQKIDALVARAEERVAFGVASSVIEELDAIEEELVQTRPGGFAHPPKLRDNLAWVARAASSQRNVYLDARPPDQLWERFRPLERGLSTQLASLERVVSEYVVRFNEAVLERRMSRHLEMARQML